MIKNVFMRWFWCLHEYLMIFPLVIIISFFAIPKDAVAVFALLLPLSLLFGIIITFVMKKTNNLFLFGIGLVYVLVVTFLWQYAALSGRIYEFAYTAAANAGFYIWGIKSGTGKSRNEFYYFFSIVIYGVSIFIIDKAPALRELLIITIAAAILLVITGLPLANRRFLIQETRQKSGLKIIPGTVVKGNTAIVAVIVTAIMLFSLWDTVLNAIASAAKAIIIFIIKVLDWLTSFITEPVQQGGGNPDLGLPSGRENESILNIIYAVITIGIILFLIFSLVKYIVRNRKRIYEAVKSFLLSLFGRFRQWSSTEQGYFDRQESLLKTEIKKRQSLLKRIFQRKPTWKDMKDNSSRVRFLYARFISNNIRRGFNFRLSDTPIETVCRIKELQNNKASRNNVVEKGTAGQIQAFNKDAVSQLNAPCNETADHEVLLTEYNKVRYGGKEPSDEKVNELKQIYL